MKILKFVAFLFYKRFYNSRSQDIAYTRTICALVVFSYLHLIQILLILNETFWLPKRNGDNNVLVLFKDAMLCAPFFLFFIVFIGKKELQTVKYDQHKIKKGYFFLVLYGILSFTLFAILIYMRKA
ncbi:MAG TPA: hypothetical protein VG738_24170 [Chitinophagaceae bacterium]|nr:hypothetical protein [Chitinophagaceae bacterium]